MNNQQILEKAISKARKKGWRIPNIFPPKTITATIAFVADTWGAGFIIFNHDFAKALWPSSDIKKITFVDPTSQKEDPDYGGTMGVPEYIFHLMMMVRREDPIAYLADNI